MRPAQVGVPIELRRWARRRIGDRGDALRRAGHAVDRVDRELAELGREVVQLARGQVLIADEHDLVLGHGVGDKLRDLGFERLAEVDAADDRADRAGDPLEGAGRGERQRDGHGRFL